MRYLVTGGCGFVGSAVVRNLVERGERVLNIDRRRRQSPAPALASVAGRPGYARLEADIGDRALMRAVFREFLPEKVIHLASAAPDLVDTHFDVEVAGTWSILEASRDAMQKLDRPARDAFRIVLASRVPLLTADSSRHVSTPQDALRKAGHSLAWEWSFTHDLPLVVCLAGEVFGPWQSGTAFASRLIGTLVTGQRFALAAGGLSQRDWLPVRDFASGLISAARAAPPRTRCEFSLGAERRDIDIAEAVCDLLDSRLGRPGGQSRTRLIDLLDDGRAFEHPLLDASAAERSLGWAPAGFHAGLDSMISWAVGQAAAGERVAAA